MTQPSHTLTVISTLDQLKTYPRPIRGLVREATDWLDVQFQKLGPARDGHLKRFSPQVTGEECRWEELEVSFDPPPIALVTITDDIDEDTTTQRPLASTDLPRRLRSVLQCLHWQKSHPPESAHSCALAIFVPPDQTKTLTRAEGQPTNTTATAAPNMELEMTRSGAHMLEWAPRFGLKVHQITRADVTEALAWIRVENERRVARTKQAAVPTRPAQTNSSPSRPNGRGSGSTDKRLFVW